MRTVLPIIIPLTLIVLATVYFFFDPAEAAWMPRCLWHTLTGTDCPGCGMQRMAHAMLHGDFAAAWRANAFALISLPFVAAFIWLEMTRTRHPQLYATLHRPWAVRIFLALILAWWLIRNLL